MNNLIKKVDSGDYIKTKRQMTIFKEFSTANNTQTFYPVKLNGSIYNKNFKEWDNVGPELYYLQGIIFLYGGASEKAKKFF